MSMHVFVSDDSNLQHYNGSRAELLYPHVTTSHDVGVWPVYWVELIDTPERVQLYATRSELELFYERP